MFKFLKSSFYYTTYYYSVNCSKSELVDSLDKLFSDRNGFTKSTNLDGKFVDYPDSFYMTPARWMIYIKNFEKEPAFLKGILSEPRAGQTEVEIAVRPNSVHLILAIFFLPVEIFMLVNGLLKEQLNSIFGGIWLAFFAVPFLIFIARRASASIRTSFEEYLKLPPGQTSD
jgi:hypothetical protein